jgi:hypothetical protein
VCGSSACAFRCRTATDFGMVRREVMDLVKLMVPTLQQKLYSELNKKLIEVSEVGYRGGRGCGAHGHTAHVFDAASKRGARPAQLMAFMCAWCRGVTTH